MIGAATRILLDGNVYDLLVNDAAAIAAITELSKAGVIEIICNQIVREELEKSPYGKVPNWFPVTFAYEPGAFIGYGLIAPGDVDPRDTRYARIMPDKSVYSEHVGGSNKSKDAIIADTASKTCKIAVSEDKRFVHRLIGTEIAHDCKAMNHADFLAYLDDLSTNSSE
ncbi:MAG: hypothetical protein PF961_11945 [Planctomycetota bacterium]|jgi:hypothetical protein|nr:hypothetical protein [Planctomycetota bacterium]